MYIGTLQKNEFEATCSRTITLFSTCKRT